MSGKPLPTRNLDVVMKGGITSGVVYPEAIHELSLRYRFRSIGGTSAGAIAAAATAAAEVGRHRGDPESFDRLARLPRALSEPVGPRGESRLFALFQPTPATAPLYRSFVSALGKKTLRRRLLAGFAGLLRSFPGPALAALAASALVASGWTAFNLRFGGTAVAAVALVPAAALSALAVAVAVVAACALRLLRTIPDNGYGLCTGYAPRVDGPAPPLTEYLYELFNDLAGQERDRPLTFGDLWWPGGRPAELPDGEPEDPAVRLQMMTTNLTHGRPYRVPFLGREQNLFYFRRDELERLFPPEVVRWMVAHARPASGDPPHEGFVPLPPARDLPVIVATRMSLSFPLLISTVPLYAVDHSVPGEKKPKRCLFSDGGITSNFPVHFFDAPLPRWPTVAINLRPYHAHHPEGHVYKPRNNGQGLAEWWTDIDRGTGLDRLKAFGWSIVDCMQNWMDNTQLKMPGYRDRIVHVSLEED